MSSLFYLEQKIHIKSKVPTIIGSESLFIYVVHLIIIYGSVLNLGLKYLWGGKFNVLQSLAVFVFLLLFMTWFAVFWHHGKIKYRKTFIYLRIGFIILFIFFFYIKWKIKRLLYIDYLRGLAVIVMIEVHVVNAFLIRETRAEWWFVIVNYINGLVAPSFLFITGFAFIIVSERKWENYLSGGKYLRKQLLRILQIILIDTRCTCHIFLTRNIQIQFPNKC